MHTRLTKQLFATHYGCTTKVKWKTWHETKTQNREAVRVAALFVDQTMHSQKKERSLDFELKLLAVRWIGAENARVHKRAFRANNNETKAVRCSSEDGYIPLHT